MGNNSAEALVLDGLGKSYGRAPAVHKALDGVHLRVPHGQLLGLIGHNGAGKSTLFKLVLGLIAPTAGRVTVDGIGVGGRNFRSARQSMGYLPENLVLYDNLTGLETMRFFARLKNAPDAQCAQLLERVGLGAAAHRAVREYSKGMRQRLGFAQALLGDPQLLLLDEPTTGLDPAAIRLFYEQLQQLRDRGVTIVISSHILAELQQRVDRLAMLANGRLRAEGSVAQLRDRSRLPVVFQIQATEQDLNVMEALLQKQVQVLSGVVLERQGHQTLSIQCPRHLKMPLFMQLASTPLHDLQVLEPTLEDVYFEMGQTP